jgi:hypothetical protein
MNFEVGSARGAAASDRTTEAQERTPDLIVHDLPQRKHAFAVSPSFQR